jgi:archaemetzincin
MNVLHAISDLAQAPGVYAMYGGIAQKLRDRIVQRLVRTVEPSLYPVLA